MTNRFLISHIKKAEKLYSHINKASIKTQYKHLKKWRGIANLYKNEKKLSIALLDRFEYLLIKKEKELSLKWNQQ